MKLSLNAAVLMTAAILAGCSLSVLGQLRAQLKSPEKYFIFKDEGEYFSIRFLEPLIRNDNLEDLGLPGTDVLNGNVQFSCQLLLEGCAERPGFMSYKIADGYLEQIRIPAVFGRIFGLKNIVELLRFSGGTEQARFQPITDTQIMDALRQERCEVAKPGNSVTFRLMPTAAQARILRIVLTRKSPNEDFKEILISFKYRGN